MHVVARFRQGCASAAVHQHPCMKTIAVNVSEPVYREFQEQARRQDRTAAELIREAMEAYRQRWVRSSGSLRDLPPLDLGAIEELLSGEDDLLGEMLD